MEKTKINCEQANKIELFELLLKLGIVCKKSNDYEAWFLSPFRKESIASFKVSKKLNKWYDHGEGFGGNTIDLITGLKNCSVKDALSFLSQGSFSFQQPGSFFEKPKQEFSIIKKQNLQTRALLDYLKSRGISDGIARIYCFEVYYRNNGKTYFAIAFRNNSGGMELRNKYFKGCTGSKNITTIENGAKSVKIFEGFIDFLSYQEYYNSGEETSDFVICNSTALLRKLHPIIDNYNTVEIFFDNDQAGKKSLNLLKKERTDIIDASPLYREFKDLNESIMKSNLT